MNPLDRKYRVLSNIVELYIQTGEPVGSKAVSARLEDMCSSATIRNDMCDLIERGYLIQPHTSAGRVPSVMGFRYYIDHLMDNYQLTPESKQRILAHLPKFRGDPERFISEIGKAVASLTGCTAIITSPVDREAALKRLEILQMGPSSVLVAILTSSGLMKSKLCQLDTVISGEEIVGFNRVLNERFSNIKLAHITPATAQTMAVSFGIQTLKYAPMLEQVFEAAKEAIQPTMVLEGQANLLLYKEFSPAAVIELFARRESLLSMLENTHATKVLLGSELRDAALYNAGLVVTDYSLGKGPKGKIAVLGPLKNDYYRLIPTMEYLAKAIEENLKVFI